tara:strand:+ start:1162 stop:1551 length:390 start_codon:yes stop_codon:yes gene_type:complete
MPYRKVYIPNDILGKTEKANRHKPHHWKHIYFFRGARGVSNKFNTSVMEQYEILNSKSYNKNTLYKCKKESDESALFDYYKILKTTVRKKHGQIATTKQVDKSDKKKHEGSGLRIINYPKDKPYILSFD